MSHNRGRWSGVEEVTYERASCPALGDDTRSRAGREYRRDVNKENGRRYDVAIKRLYCSAINAYICLVRLQSQVTKLCHTRFKLNSLCVIK